MMRDGMEDARIGRTIDGRYRVLKRLAAGGMGVVYRAERVGLAKPVAIKFLHRSQAAVANRRERFDREAAAMSRLSHPNLVSIIDYGELDDTPYLVMDFHKGESLRGVLERGRLPPPRAVDFARQLLAGLGSAHASGVVHRDLKPANVLITGKPGHELVKVLDFGVAKLLEGDGRPSELSVMAGSLLGTAEYMAPEQARCEVIDPRADIYAVGILLYEMLTGRRPFEAERDLAVLRMQVEDEPARPTVHVPTLSPALERAVLRALEKDRERRWPTAEEFAAALAATPEGRIEAPRRAIAAEPAIATEPVRRRRRRWPWLAALLVLPVVAAAALYVAHDLGYVHLRLPSWLADRIGWDNGAGAAPAPARRHAHRARVAAPPPAVDAAPPDAALPDAAPPDGAPPDGAPGDGGIDAPGGRSP
jgi:eukaryotic-like serine/threonine-protein kinase